jgi:phage anti-repressor protein
MYFNKLTMLDFNERGNIYGEEIHRKVRSKNKNYRDWLNDKIDYADLKEGKDFFAISLKSTGGRPKMQYEFTLEAAKEICLLERNEYGKEIRQWLISISSQVENKDLLNEQEILTLSSLIGFFKYIDNQNEILTINKDQYAAKHPSKYSFAEFHNYRNSILQISKEDVEKKLKEYCAEQNKRLPKLNSKNDKILFIDMYDGLKNAVWDFLYVNGTPTALKMSELAKKMAKAQGISILPKNEDNLFQIKENIKLKGLNK